MGVCYANDTNRRGVPVSKREDGGECMRGFYDMIEFVKDNETARGESIGVE